MDNTIITETQTELRARAEVFWFQGTEAKTEKQRDAYHKEYHRIHDIIRGLDAFRRK